jgi:hypothetical protein
VAHREVVPLAGNWSSQGSAESVDHRRVPAHGLAWLLEGLLHQGHRVVGEQGELLVLGHGVIACSKQVLGDLAVSERLLVSSGRRITLDPELASLLLASSLGCVHVLHHLVLGELLLLGVVVLSLVAAHSVVHECLHGLFSLWSVWLELVQRVVKDLFVVREELSELIQVDLDNNVLSEELTNDMEDVLEHILEDCLLELGLLGHTGEVWLLQWLHDDIPGLPFELSHLWLVFQLKVFEEVLAELNVEDPDVISDLLVADDAELRHVDGPADLHLRVAPLYESVPDQVVGRLTDDAPDRVGIASEVSVDCLIAKALNVVVAVTTRVLHIHLWYQQLILKVFNRI